MVPAVFVFVFSRARLLPLIVFYRLVERLGPMGLFSVYDMLLVKMSVLLLLPQ